MPVDQEDLKKLGCAVVGGLVGAALIQNHHDEARKSQAERDEPEGVEWLCGLIGEILDDWEPRSYEREDRYTEALFRYLRRELRRALQEGDPSVSLEMRIATSRGIPDILINDRLIGQRCDYSREWVTWAIVIDMPDHRIRELEELLDAKSLHNIEVIPFSFEDEDDSDDGFA